MKFWDHLEHLEQNWIFHQTPGPSSFDRPVPISMKQTHPGHVTWDINLMGLESSAAKNIKNNINANFRKVMIQPPERKCQLIPKTKPSREHPRTNWTNPRIAWHILCVQADSVMFGARLANGCAQNHSAQHVFHRTSPQANQIGLGNGLWRNR